MMAMMRIKQSRSFDLAILAVIGILLAVGMIGSRSTRAATTTQPAVADLVAGPQLFIDDFLIAQSDGIKKVTQHPERFLDHPVLGVEQHTTQPYMTVLRDASSGRFRMWYDYDMGENGAIALADSDDGIHWTLPKLGIMGPDNRLMKIGRSHENGSFGCSVVDLGAVGQVKDSNRRYAMMWWSALTSPPGAAIAFSCDGLHWTPNPDNPVLPYYPPESNKGAIGVGDITDLFWDPMRNRFGALVKLAAQPSDGWSPGPRAGSIIRRLVGAASSEDGIHWTEPHRVIVPEKRDPGLLEFYSAGGTIARGPLLISFVRMLHDDYSPDPNGKPTGIGYATLATSRDGEHWTRQDDIFFNRSPTPGSWDHAMSWIGSSLVVGDEIYLYYGGYARGHKVEPTKERQIGMVKMPLDRFVAIEPMHDRAMLTTIPLRTPSDADVHLTINADASGGRIRVQVQDENGTPLPHLGFNDCDAIQGNGMRLPVAWKSGATLPRQSVIRLQFELTHAQLFAFEAAP